MSNKCGIVQYDMLIKCGILLYICYLFVVFQKAKFVGNRRGPSVCIRGILTGL